MNHVVGIFLVLHGLVHLLYVGHALRLFEIEESMTWPDGSWLVSRFLRTDATRLMAAALCVVATAGFVIAGAGLIGKQGWWEPVTVVSAIFSTILFFLLWDGRSARINQQGGVAVLINVAILIAVLVVGWPDFDF